MRVIVIGAGLGGLTLAQGLRRAGIDVVVYERDGVQGRPQGISLHVDDRGASALRTCLPPAHAAMVEATMGGPRERTLTLSDGDGALTVVGAQPTDGIGNRARPGRQGHRPLFRAVLLTGLEDAVHFGAEFTRFERRPGRPDGAVRAWFADGRMDTGDVLVGADGIGSQVRRRLLPHARVVDTGRRTLMGATPVRAISATALPGEPGELPGLIGDSPATMRVRDTMIALGVLRFTQPPVLARQRWLPALHPGAVVELEDYVMWALPTTQERLGSATAWRRARELAADLPPALRSVVAEARPEVTVVLRGATIQAMPAWPAGPVTVIGDAIHPAPGFGGNLAMRDAERLCRALVEVHRGRAGLVEAIGEYEDEMRRDCFPTPAAVKAAT